MDQIAASAYGGDVEAVRRIISDGVAVDAPTSAKASTALHWASFGGSLGVCELLVNAGADANKANADRATPLHFACQRCHAEIVRWLVSACGADANAIDKSGKTPVHRVVAAGASGRAEGNWEELFRWLLENGDVDLDTLDDIGIEEEGGAGDAGAGDGDAAAAAAGRNGVIATARKILDEADAGRDSGVSDVAGVTDVTVASMVPSPLDVSSHADGMMDSRENGAKAAPSNSKAASFNGLAPFQGGSASAMLDAPPVRRVPQRAVVQSQSFLGSFFEELLCCGTDTTSEGDPTSPCYIHVP